MQHSRQGYLDGVPRAHQGLLARRDCAVVEARALISALSTALLVAIAVLCVALTASGNIF